MRLSMRTAPPARLTPADLMLQLADDAHSLASRMMAPARTVAEAEYRVEEGERIALAVRKLVRGGVRVD